MPPVSRDVVKERARRLRERGEAALKRHLDALVGSRARVLVEIGDVGRTEGFAPVRFPRGARAGDLLEVDIAEHDGRELIAA
jgi:threonylcarbamoyladenosine tRNA methylthiotransferase MtaB